MNKKVLNLAIASALCFAPLSHAAQDTSGMQYTSAAEGFYASIRARFTTESAKDGGAGIENSSSRFGVRGSNDLGNGLKGFYQYEAGVGIDNGSGLSTRVGQVGLEGAFGRVWAGSGWVETHNMTYGSTDIANSGSGNLTYSKIRPGRGSNMIQYRSPDIGGFQFGLGLNLKGGADNDARASMSSYTRAGISARTRYAAPPAGGNNHFIYGSDGKLHVVNVNGSNRTTVVAYSDGNEDLQRDSTGVYIVLGTAMVTTRLNEVTESYTYASGDACNPAHAHDAIEARDCKTAAASDDNNVEMWSLAAKYSVQGFTGAFAYSVRPDTAGVYREIGDNKIATTKKDDYTSWTARLGYAQDNWYVNGWHGKDNDGDLNSDYDDAEYTSIGGGVAVGKVNLYAVWEKADYGSALGEDAFTVLGVQYNLGSRSRVWMDFIAQDKDTSTTEEDHIKIGLQHDF